MEERPHHEKIPLALILLIILTLSLSGCLSDKSKFVKT